MAKRAGLLLQLRPFCLISDDDKSAMIKIPSEIYFTNIQEYTIQSLQINII
jgi:hypothetical protein